MQTKDPACPIVTGKQYFTEFEKYKGKMLTVQYQGYTNKNNVPRFPIGLRIREDM